MGFLTATRQFSKRPSQLRNKSWRGPPPQTSREAVAWPRWLTMAAVSATEACPARKIPASALFYAPSKDFVGNDSVQIEVDAGNAKIPDLSFSIMVQEVK